MDEIIYHYTTGAGLLGMIKDYTKDEPDVKLWASHYMYMNDPNEYTIGERLCTDIINRIETALKIPDAYRTNLFVNTTDYRNALKSYRKTLDGQSICPYIVSLSREYDSLPMWNMYASNGNGIALGFNRLKLLGAQILPMDCYYVDSNDPSNQEYISQLETEIKELYLELDREYPVHIIQECINDDDNTLLYNRLHSIHALICVSIGIRIKDIAYRLENEVRITTPHRPEAPKILFRERNGIIIPYVEYPISFDCVENIVVGPTADFIRVRESISILLDSKGIKWEDDRIIKSKVPYRN